MTSRDTYDMKCWEQEEEEAKQAHEDHLARSAEEFALLGEEKKIKSYNIQPSLVAKLLAQSEPCLFANKSPVAVVPYQLPAIMLIAHAVMWDAVQWHAGLQVSFDRSLNEKLISKGANQ